MTDEHTADTNELNTTETPEATITRLARDLQSTRQQRDFLGSQLSDRITRFHAARVAHGDCAFDVAGGAIRAEIDALERHCGASLRKWLLDNTRDVLTVSEILTDALKVLPERQTPALARQAGQSIRALGWKPSTQRPYAGAPPQRVFLSPDAAKQHSLAGGPGRVDDLIWGE